MALLIGDNFSYNGKKPNFERDSFETLAALKSFSEANIDNGHIAYCVETKKHYIFNDSNSDDATTGKWRVLESEFSNKVNVSDLDNYLTKENAQSIYQPIGNYALKSDISNLATKDEIPDISNLAAKSEIPTKVSELENDSNFLTSIPEEYVTETELQEAISGVQFKLPIASSNTLGGIKVGAGLSITADGILSATGGGVADSVAWENVVGRPTKLSQFTNDSGFITSDSLSNYALKSELPDLTDYAKKSEIPDISGLATKSELSGYALVDHTHVVADITDFPEIPDVSNLATKTELAAKQDALISGTNIKTINGTSLLGSGNITIESSGGGSEIIDVLDNKTYARTQGSWVDLTDWLTWGEFD